MTVTGLDSQIEIVNLTIACYGQIGNRAKTQVRHVGSAELSRWRLAYALSIEPKLTDQEPLDKS